MRRALSSDDRVKYRHVAIVFPNFPSKASNVRIGLTLLPVFAQLAY